MTMIVSASAPLNAADMRANSVLSTYRSGANWINILRSDAFQATLPAEVTADPNAMISQIAGEFTFPDRFFGQHVRGPEYIAELAAAGLKTIRLRDTASTFHAMVIKGGTATVQTSPANRIAWGLGDFSTNAAGVILTGDVPAPLQANTFYYAINLSGGAFQLTDTPGGAAIALPNAPVGTLYCMTVRRENCDPISGNGSFDKLVAQMRLHGVKGVYDASMTPPTLSTAGDSIYYIAADPAYPIGWWTFLYNTYGDVIEAIECWNEFNDINQFKGTKTGSNNDLYVHCSRIRTLVDDLSWDCLVVSPNTILQAAAATLDAWLAIDDTASLFDAIACHPYRDQMYQTFDAIVGAYAAVANTYGKELWLTEFGDRNADANLIWRWHLIARAKGAARAYPYFYDNEGNPDEEGVLGMAFVTRGLDGAYREMVTALDGQTLPYLNRAGGRVCTELGGKQVLA